jgi:uncharacterized protein YgbK (DUF1537 family)
MRQRVKLGIIADDLTGAMDAGLPFALAGLETTVAMSTGRVLDSEVVAINTDSRAADVQEACKRVKMAASQLAGRRLYKKIDSTLRGYVGAELLTLMVLLDIDKAVLCPAFIEGGRTLIDGQLRVDGKPLNETSLVNDPMWPMNTSDVATLLGLPATLLGLECVEGGLDTLQKAINRAKTRVVIVDAVRKSHLETIGQAIAAGNWLPCGSTGLAAAWVKALGLHKSYTPPRPQVNSAPVLVVAGSRNPVTIKQIRCAQAVSRLSTIELAPGDEEADRWAGLEEALKSRSNTLLTSTLAQLVPEAGPSLNALMGRLTARACQEFELAGIVLTGGDTAMVVCEALGTSGMRIIGELQAGIPYGTLIGGSGERLWSVTKAGGFGSENVLVEAMSLMQGA